MKSLALTDCLHLPVSSVSASQCDLMFPCVIAFGFVQIREELRANGIDVYPQKEFDEDAEDRMINDKIRVSSQSQSGSDSVQQLQ